MDSTGGSSPLARGLLLIPFHSHNSIGIIPARAGFTALIRCTVPHGWDHPRSRGVYCAVISVLTPSMGSSPLARGLQPSSSESHHNYGIIPARAGFTRFPNAASSAAADHPRSRGVYCAVISVLTPSMGSSPLARGLQPSSSESHHNYGIIPARAGFTRFPNAASSAAADHPRSRGVYFQPAYSSHPHKGSSPLARGLPELGPRRCKRRRIIPARAGFTTGACIVVGHYWDHPRSRGVYVDGALRGGRCRGSSPLARGLHVVDDDDRRASGIIPARAGFTWPVPSSAGSRADHPRSRGVYYSTPTRSTVSVGSSPLARGLPPGRRGRVGGGRIIPARAGFTTGR